MSIGTVIKKFKKKEARKRERERVCEIWLHYLSSSLNLYNYKLKYSINYYSSNMFVELGCLCNMCNYFYLINQLDPVYNILYL